MAVLALKGLTIKHFFFQVFLFLFLFLFLTFSSSLSHSLSFSLCSFLFLCVPLSLSFSLGTYNRTLTFLHELSPELFDLKLFEVNRVGIWGETFSAESLKWENSWRRDGLKTNIKLLCFGKRRRNFFMTETEQLIKPSHTFHSLMNRAQTCSLAESMSN